MVFIYISIAYLELGPSGGLLRQHLIWKTLSIRDLGINVVL